MKNFNEYYFFILGGYGNAGIEIAKLLLQEFPKSQVTIAGRKLEKARAAVHTLEQMFQLEPNQLRAQVIDASNPEDLIWAFSKANLVINAASTIPFTDQVVKALLETKVDYIDTQLSSPAKWAVLEANESRFTEANICCISDGGYHPGIPAALVRYAAENMDNLESAQVYGGMKLDWGKYEFSPPTMKELVDEFKHYEPLIFKDGKWQKRSFRNLPCFDFGEPIGPLSCTPMDMKEMHPLPEIIPSLRNTGFFVSGFNKIVDNWLMPIVYMGIKMFPQSWSMPFARLFRWGLKFCKPPFGIKLVADCKGEKEGKAVQMEIALTHPDAYVLTAVPVVACIKQWAEEDIRQAGLWMQAHIVKPKSFLEDIQDMGIELEIKQNLPQLS